MRILKVTISNDGVRNCEFGPQVGKFDQGDVPEDELEPNVDEYDAKKQLMRNRVKAQRRWPTAISPKGKGFIQQAPNNATVCPSPGIRNQMIYRPA